MKHLFQIICMACLCAAPVYLRAEVVRFEGRLTIDGNPYTGKGAFRFAVVASQGTMLWTTGSVELAVNQGVYSTELGSAAEGMQAIPESIWNGGQPLTLRVWFQHGERGWQQVGGDTPLGNPTANESSTGQVGAASGMTAAQGAAILAELREIRALLGKSQQPAAPPPAQFVSLPVRSAPSVGAETASVVVVEFTDLQCGFCKRFHEQVFPTLKSEFVDTGKIRFVSRQLPLGFHPRADPAARALISAHRQKRFWDLRDKLFALADDLSDAAMEEAARKVGLDMAAFQAALTAPETLSAMRMDADDAKAVGITGTPSFIIGRISGDKITGKLVVGAQPLAVFQTEITRLINDTKGELK